MCKTVPTKCKKHSGIKQSQWNKTTRGEATNHGLQCQRRLAHRVSQPCPSPVSFHCFFLNLLKLWYLPRYAYIASIKTTHALSQASWASLIGLATYFHGVSPIRRQGQQPWTELGPGLFSCLNSGNSLPHTRKLTSPLSIS